MHCYKLCKNHYNVLNDHGKKSITSSNFVIQRNVIKKNTLLHKHLFIFYQTNSNFSFLITQKKKKPKIPYKFTELH